MRKAVTWALGWICLPAVVAAQPPRIEWRDHLMLASHVDALSGMVLLRGYADGRVVVLVDMSVEPGQHDGRADHLIVFQSDTASLGVVELRGLGVVRFWHQGLRVSIPAASESIDLQLAESTRPRESPAWEAATAAAVDGTGLVEYSGAGVERLVMDDAAGLDRQLASMLLPIEPSLEGADPGGAGGIGSCATSSSVTCGGGSCSASCARGQRADHACANAGRPRCTCSSCLPD